MGASVLGLFAVSFVVSLAVFIYQRALLHVSPHFTILACAVIGLCFTEKVRNRFFPHAVGLAAGCLIAFLINLFQTQWKQMGELVLSILDMVFPGASWLKIFDSWLERLPYLGFMPSVEINALVLFINVALGGLFLWATIRFVHLRGKPVVEAILALAFLNTLAVGRLYFTWPPIFWGSLIYFGGALLIGWMCAEKKIKREELSWVAGVGNLPWWLIGIGLAYRILENPQELIERARELGVGFAGVPVALAVAVILLATWAVLHTFVQWLIIRGSQRFLFDGGQNSNAT